MFQSRLLCLRQCRARQEFLAGGAHGLILGQTPQPGGGVERSKRGATSTFSKWTSSGAWSGSPDPIANCVPVHRGSRMPSRIPNPIIAEVSVV